MMFKAPYQYQIQCSSPFSVCYYGKMIDIVSVQVDQINYMNTCKEISQLLINLAWFYNLIKVENT